MLEWDEVRGWLPSLLHLLKVPVSSQTLVFSKTSMQFRQIFPSRPRALYFSDDVYVGWVPGAERIELVAVDPEQGAMFYTLEQRRPEGRASRPEIRRDPGECLSCHVSRRTQHVPGLLVRSVYPQSDGQPDFRLGTLTTDHRTPFEDRFGGWYVTGTHGNMRHRGNIFLSGDAENPLDRETGANLARLPSIVREARYPAPGSDLVALMLLEHQTQMHNWITRASFVARQAMHLQRSMNKALGRPATHVGDSTRRRLDDVAEGLLRYMMFVDEFELTAPVAGSSEFAAEFQAAAILDSRGRGLRQLDLKRRLLRYPCSYLIYSESFFSLPEDILTRLKKRMLQVLTGADPSGDFGHIETKDRRIILEILRETHPLFKTDSEKAVEPPTVERRRL